VVVVSLTAWAYWPTFVEMERAWSTEPDYSHGYLVIPAALYLLWERRSAQPKSLHGPAWGGLSLIILAAALRIFGARFYMAALDGWSIPLAVAGAVWLLLGRNWLAWSWPCIGFLVFMVPLPWRLETYFSLPLQRVAATWSTWVLQCLGYPAVQEGNTILMGALQLEVEEACSGLRMVIGVTALTFGCLILCRMEWWQRLLMLLGIVPIALIANCSRIVVTGLMYGWVSGDWAHRFSHDFAGWAVIPLAAALLWGYHKYLRKLVIEYRPEVMARRST
jgi:exosortase